MVVDTNIFIGATAIVNSALPMKERIELAKSWFKVGDAIAIAREVRIRILERINQ